MADMIYTPDGKRHIAFDENSVLELVREYVGDDTYNYIKGYMYSANLSFEEEKDENEYLLNIFNDFIQDIKDEVEYIQEMFSKPKLNRTQLKKCIDHMYDKILEQI